MIIRNLIKMSFVQKSIATIRQHEQFKKRRKSLFGVKLSNIAVYAGIFLLVVSMIYVGYDQPQKTSAVSNANLDTTVGVIAQPSVDDVVAANVAAGVAQTINLPVADAVSNFAVTVRVQSQIANIENSSIISKPQIIESVVENKNVKSYTVVAGDTIASLAGKFKVSEQTIRWANKLKVNDLIEEGDVLKILPIDGVLYTVKSTDTFDSITEKYEVNKTRFITYNDLEVSGLVVNNNIILPDGILPEEERPDYVAPVINRIAYGYSGGNVVYLNITNWSNPYQMSDTIRSMLPSYLNSLRDSTPGNPMKGWYTGQCTWWAWERRVALGNPLPAGVVLGNAGSWARSLSGLYKVDQNPQAGDIFESWGHVGIVESVERNNLGEIVSFTTSEMNYPYTPYQVVARTIPASNIGDFDFIH